MKFIGAGRKVIDLITDSGSFVENKIGTHELTPGYGPGAVVGAARCAGETITLIANDAQVRNPRFKVVHSGLIGLEEAYKMAEAVYLTIEADKDKPVGGKRPIVLIVDTPGNAPGKTEEILGINKATVAYQLAMSESRKKGHPSVALVVGRAISGGFLCHGLHAGIVLCLSEKFNTMVHVMPVTSIARIIKVPREFLEERAKTDPVFASGVGFAYKLGLVDAVIDDETQMKPMLIDAINAVRTALVSGKQSDVGPEARFSAAVARGGRKTAGTVMQKMRESAGPALRELNVL